MVIMDAVTSFSWSCSAAKESKNFSVECTYLPNAILHFVFLCLHLRVLRRGHPNAQIIGMTYAVKLVSCHTILVR